MFSPCLTGMHPHQSGGPMPNPALYAAPPVSMSPGQPPPQQLLPPPFYPPPGVMTFSNTNYPYPAGATLPPMYPNPQVMMLVFGTFMPFLDLNLTPALLKHAHLNIPFAFFPDAVTGLWWRDIF